MALGMPLPNHPADLFFAFTLVAFALLGLGMVVATLADNVPAVQALGQCIFLPMLIIGGVAVQLSSLPQWAQHLSAFFPGRYAVEAMQPAVNGPGLGVTRFSLLALFLIGTAGFLAGVKMFRWDAEQRWIQRHDKGWIVMALASWAAVGLLAEQRGRIGPVSFPVGTEAAAIDGIMPVPPLRNPPPTASEPAPAQPTSDATQPETAAPKAAPVVIPPVVTPSAAEQKAEAASAGKRGRGRETGAPPVSAAHPSAANPPAANAPATNPPAAKNPPPAAKTPPNSDGRGSAPPEPARWQDVTPAHIDEVAFERLPSDSGVVTPIAPPDEPLDPDLDAELQEVRSRLATWAPARVADPVQRVRNVLYVAAVPDVFQVPLERYLPHVVFERLEMDVPKQDLIKILFWVATHPTSGDDSATDDLASAGLRVNGPADVNQARERVMIYALKLLGRLTGKRP
jgi:hypothetical protein